MKPSWIVKGDLEIGWEYAIVIPEEIIEKIKEKTKNLYDKYNHLDRKGLRWIGKVGEMAIVLLIQHFFPDTPDPVWHKDKWGRDITWGSMILEVKTKSTTVVPKPHHTGAIAEDQFRKSKATHYVFCRFQESTSTVFVQGLISHDRFTEIADVRKRGEEYSRDDGTTFTQPANNRDITQNKLGPFEYLGGG